VNLVFVLAALSAGLWLTHKANDPISTPVPQPDPARVAATAARIEATVASIERAAEDAAAATADFAYDLSVAQRAEGPLK
jgi:hypothetical protein